jgi:ribonuclease Z
MSWATGRIRAIEVYGPKGVEQVVKGFIMAYELDTGYRIAHHGADIVVPEAGIPVIKTIELKDSSQRKLIFDKNELKIYAFEVDHAPVKPAFGYRIEYRGKIAVITGDTVKTDNLVKHCKNADILFSEAISYEMLNNIVSGAKRRKLDRFAKILTDIQNYHMEPVVAATVAKEAQVKKLVFTHVTPPLPNEKLVELYLKGVSDIYKGEVLLGKDCMKFRL